MQLNLISPERFVQLWEECWPNWAELLRKTGMNAQNVTHRFRRYNRLKPGMLTPYPGRVFTKKINVTALAKVAEEARRKRRKEVRHGRS